MKTEELLALGVFGRSSRLGERIARLLDRRREFSPYLSRARVALGGFGLIACVIAAAIAPRLVAFPQQESRLTFDAISVRPAAEGGRPNFVIGPTGRLTVTAWAVKPMIQKAYDIPGFFVSGGPNWINFDRYDIEAKADDAEGVTADERNAYQKRMLARTRGLLADRFQLMLRGEKKELAGYALTVAKAGPKLEVSRESTPVVEGLMNPDGSKRAGILARGGARNAQGRFLGGATMKGQMATMAMLADMLTRNLGRPVEDKTGLMGTYDFAIEFAPEVDDSGSAPTLVTALQQLGLRLESAKVPIETLVIDKVEKPSEN